MSGIFVSGAGDDIAAAQRVAHVLEDEVSDVWFDDQHEAGDAAWQEILRRIDSCDAFVVVLSRTWVNSTKCLAEWRYATALGKPVLGVRIGALQGSELSVLGDTRIVDFTPSTSDASPVLAATLDVMLADGGTPAAGSAPLPATPVELLLRRPPSSSEQLSGRRQLDILARLRESAEKATTEPARAEIRTQLEALRDHPDVTQVARDRSAALLDRLRGRRGGRVRRRSTRTVRQRKWRVGCGVLLVLLMAAGIAVLVTRTGERAADSSLTHDQLTHLLLTQDDVDDVAGTTDMRVTAYSAKTDYSDDVFADHPECGVASTTASRRLYGDFDYTGVANQLLTSGNPDSLTVAQTLVAFATADEASTILENAARSWSACAGRTPSSSPDSADPMRFEDVVRGAASISQISEQPGVTLGTCQHVLAVVRAVVIETLGCASERTNIAERLADELARRVDRYADYLPPTREQNEPLFTVLLTPRELAAQQGTEQALDRFADEPRVNGSWMSVQKCDSATTHGTWRTYAGTRYVGFALQDTRGSSAGAQDRDVYQAVAAYANDVTATAVMDRTDEAWNDCADSEVQVVTPAGDRTRWRFDPVSRSGSTIVQLKHDVDAVANPWSCEHAMAVSGSDVYEAMVCDGDAAGEATSVVDRMVRNARS